MRLWLIILVIFVPLYLFRLSFASRSLPEIPAGAKLKVVGRISNEPYPKDSNQLITLGAFLVKTSRFPGYSYGQKLEIIGKPEVKVISRFSKKFIFNYPSIRVLAEEKNLINQITIQRFLFNTKGRAEKLFSEILPEPQASLLAGILLGSKKQLAKEYTQILRDTGTIHVVVASGYNISVVAGFLVSFFVKLLKRKQALVIALLGILFYTLMVGAEPPVIRATIMAGLTYLAQFLGREKDAPVSLFVAAFLMLLVSPLILFDIGFQLSFLATAGILFICPKLNQKFFNLPFLGDELRVTLAAQIGTLPILISNFGQLNFLSPLINALVLPLVPLITCLGGIAAILGLFFKPFGQTLVLFVWVPLTIFVKLTSWFANLSWSSFSLGRISSWWILSYYLILGIWILRNQKLFSQA